MQDPRESPAIATSCSSARSSPSTTRRRMSRRSGSPSPRRVRSGSRAKQAEIPPSALGSGLDGWSIYIDLNSDRVNLRQHRGTTLSAAPHLGPQARHAPVPALDPRLLDIVRVGTIHEVLLHQARGGPDHDPPAHIGTRRCASCHTPCAPHRMLLQMRT
ncbi:hypothetical protein SCP_1103020 [Sparassis crispa]|uniref:Uncharacterized protein n=1 Tax=Sparassis crispa TaxID=139825 RepID=A0A401GZM5_9APHY|nr:hypothetical protein SCP_1103020 [Sparassis crispa]GBE87625.1 hypothetical protein SCP_1103020 [Sparassis crispa]